MTKTVGSPIFQGALAAFLLTSGCDPVNSEEPAEGAELDPLDIVCSSGGVESASLTSNALGLFVSMTVWSPQGGGVNLYHYDGSGWTLVEGMRRIGTVGLAAFETGPLISYGSSETCAIEFLDLADPAASRCSSGASEVDRVFVVHEQLAYASNLSSLIEYDGEHWIESPAATSSDFIYGVWADDASVAITTASGVLAGAHGAPLEKLSAVEGVYLSSVWGFGRDDLWVAHNTITETGYTGSLVHFDGAGWNTRWPTPHTELGPGCARTPRVVGLWGAQGELFFHTRHGLYRYRHGQVETFFDAGCTENVRFLSLWGNSPSDVYVALQNVRTASDCTSIEVLHFDGVSWGALAE